MDTVTTTPTTLLDIAESGLSWKINVGKNRYRLHYTKDGVESLHLYTAEELDAIDVRIVKILQKAYQWVSKDMLQKALVSSYNLWQSEPHVLRRNGKAYYLVTIKAADLAEPGHVKLAYIYHALYGEVDGLPVARGHMVAVPDAILKLSTVEAAYPGFEKAFNVANAMGLTRFDAGKFCMDYLSTSRPETDDPSVTLPDTFDPR